MTDAAPSHALSASTFKRLHPQAYFNRFLPHSFRPDGRPLADDAARSWRAVSVNRGSISTASGSALVRMGETTVTCGVKAEIFEPSMYSPSEGCIVPNVDLPALCSPQFKPGPPADEAQILSSQLNRILSHPSVLPLASLGIEHGRAAWVLYIDVVCINYDGNPLDACLVAVMAALRDARLPQATWDADRAQVVCSRAAPTRPLALGPANPLACSFAVVDGKTVLPDPTAFEASLLTARVTVVLLQPIGAQDDGEKKDARLMLVEQHGLGGVTGPAGGIGTKAVLRECARRARARASIVQELLEDGA